VEVKEDIHVVEEIHEDEEKAIQWTPREDDEEEAFAANMQEDLALHPLTASLRRKRRWKMNLQHLACKKARNSSEPKMWIKC
jgi:hypothetical protein